ncbi:MAG: hypothetical protein EON54_22570 [Alcaligenaceae bacterium]|nr:MAG: hypothetical protein EON54_22570 [Alcaligenaceae bacterium]
MNDSKSLRDCAKEALKMARIYPVGPERNELRQVAYCLRWLDRRGIKIREQLHALAKRRDSAAGY